MENRKTVVITGASDGIGAAAARRLHRDGHEVVVVGRSPEKTAAVADDLGADRHIADFTRLSDVTRLVGELNSSCERIDVLANNAGGVFGEETTTVDHFEMTFQINHVAPFLLTRLLLDRVAASGGSVIQTSSTLRPAGTLDLDDLNHARNYTPVRAYAAAKLENVLFTQELHRRFHSRGVSAASFFPGSVATSFGSASTSALMRFLSTNRLMRRHVLSTPEQGADQLVWLAEATPGRDWQSGAYYYKRRPSRPANGQARNPELARRFWERTEDLLRERGVALPDDAARG